MTNPNHEPDLPFTDWVIITPEEMVKPQRVIHRCRGCLWFWEGDHHCYCVCGQAQGDRVNPGWFGCWRWLRSKGGEHEKLE